MGESGPDGKEWYFKKKKKVNRNIFFLKFLEISLLSLRPVKFTALDSFRKGRAPCQQMLRIKDRCSNKVFCKI